MNSDGGCNLSDVSGSEEDMDRCVNVTESMSVIFSEIQEKINVHD